MRNEKTLDEIEELAPGLKKHLEKESYAAYGYLWYHVPIRVSLAETDDYRVALIEWEKCELEYDIMNTKITDSYNEMYSKKNTEENWSRKEGKFPTGERQDYRIIRAGLIC